MSSRIIVMDVHGITRAGVCALLESADSFEVVAQASDRDETLALARSLQPDIVVLALGFPGRDGIGLIEQLRDKVPNTIPLVLSMHEDDSLVRSALRAGARGYVPKRAPAEDLIDALHAVCRGEMYVHHSVAGHLITHLDPELARTVTENTASLTHREIQVLRNIALGHTNKETAELMSISARTVERHRASLTSKLCMRRRSELVMYARERGLLD